MWEHLRDFAAFGGFVLACVSLAWQIARGLRRLVITVIGQPSVSSIEAGGPGVEVWAPGLPDPKWPAAKRLGSGLVLNLRLHNPSSEPITVESAEASGDGVTFAYEPPRPGGHGILLRLLDHSSHIEPYLELPVRIPGGDTLLCWLRLVTSETVEKAELPLTLSLQIGGCLVRVKTRAKMVPQE